MAAEKFFAESPAEVGLDPAKVQALLDRAERDVKDGVLPACQVAMARHGKIAAMKTFGRATDESVFIAMSATKAVTSSALWLLIQEGKVSPADRIVDHVPEYGTNGKESTTIEHLLIHTAGIPDPPCKLADWGDRKRRSNWAVGGSPERLRSAPV
jgi:CubicO group peptidase (beta-lactamase class C family)